MGSAGEMGTDAAEDRQAARMGHPVADRATVACGGQEPVGAEAHQVLADRGLGAAEAQGELRDAHRALFELLHDAQPVRVRKRAQRARAAAEDLRVERTCF